ncbi:MAG: KpsF/GutQ family sugar-phosphate isomerase [bacterium]|nr:KpsF/GutQ family sugar-phosphate isomerase [bacterium]
MANQPHTPSTRRARAAEVIRIEAETIARLEELLDEDFDAAVERILACDGMVVVTGMGKAGLVGGKVSATLASTGTPSIFLHPGEALHGDLGRLRSKDILLALSNSGETAEVNAVVPVARKIGAAVIGMMGRRQSTLAGLVDQVLDIGRVEEACPLKLAPTASTSAMLALGDALAMVVLAERGFEREDYALYHPAGSLGRRLMTVAELMRQGDELPLVALGTSVTDVLLLTSKTPGKPGAALVVDDEGKLAGIFTDGDLRRLLEGGDIALLGAAVDEFMGRQPKTLTCDQLAEEAHHLLRENRVDQAPVLDADERPIGLIDVQDLLDIGI